jgi:hypothetical protein
MNAADVARFKAHTYCVVYDVHSKITRGCGMVSVDGLSLKMRKDSLEGMHKDSDVIARRADGWRHVGGGKWRVGRNRCGRLGLARATPHNP